MNRSYYAQKLSALRLEQVYALAGERVRQYLRAEIDHVARGVTPGDCVLELGCGSGRVMDSLTEKSGRVWGIDTALESLQLYRRRCPCAALAAMDAGRLAFKAQRFDLIVGIQNFISACKVPPQQLLLESLKAARPGGRILLSSYADQFWPHRLAWFRQQAAAGLLGPLDETATGDGVIVCKDGFRATTFSRKAFLDLASACRVPAQVYTVDDSSVFCEIRVPKRMG